MAHYTELTENEIAQILNSYSIENLESYEVLSGGYENTNYLINKKYVLTICEQKSEQETFQLVYLLEYLSKNNFNSSKIIKSKNNDLFLNWNGKQVFIKRFIEGRIIKDLSLDLLKKIARELALLHKIPKAEFIVEDISFSVNHFNNVKKYENDSEFLRWLDLKIIEINSVLSDDLPKAIIHSDLFYNNVIISPDLSSVSIMDFEEAGYYYRLYDIAMALIGLCFEDSSLNIAKAKTFITAYQKEIPLLKIESDRLKMFSVYAACSIAVWRYSFFNFVKTEENLQNFYLEMKAIADELQQMSDDDFNQIFIN